MYPIDGSVRPTGARMLFSMAGLLFLAILLLPLTARSEISSVTISPSTPTGGSVIEVEISGWFGDICWSPDVCVSSPWVLGNIINIAIIGYDNAGPDEACGMAIVPYTVTENIQPLESGPYVLIVTECHNSVRAPEPDIEMIFFDVVSGTDVVRVPSEQPTIQAGIDAVNVGGTVLVAPGWYVGEGNRDIDFRGKAVHLKAEGSAWIGINCDGTPANPHRAFIFNNGEDSTTMVEGFSIRNGYAVTGGAVLCNGSSPKFRSCAFSTNEAASTGGAIQAEENSNIILDGCVFHDNQAEGGGAAFFYWSSPTLRRCEFSENQAVIGGAVRALGCTSLSMDDFCFFYANRASDIGGAIHLDNTGGTLHQTSFHGNVSDNFGGALAMVYSDVTVDHSIFFSDTAAAAGGAVFISNCDPTLINCTIVDNSAPGGSGIYIRYLSAPVIENCLIAFNLGGPAVTCFENSPTVSCTDIYGHPGGDWVDCIAGMEAANGNLNLDPLFCDPVGVIIWDSSPCAADNNSCGVLIGAMDVGCQTTGISDDSQVPFEYSLAQNYPNPFNPTTTVEYTVPAATDVTVTLFNILGNRIKTLVDEFQPAGSYRIDWDGTADDGGQVATGIYIYRIEAGSFVAARKMMLVK